MVVRCQLADCPDHLLEASTIAALRLKAAQQTQTVVLDLLLVDPRSHQAVIDGARVDPMVVLEVSVLLREKEPSNFQVWRECVLAHCRGGDAEGVQRALRRMRRIGGRIAAYADNEILTDLCCQGGAAALATALQCFDVETHNSKWSPLMCAAWKGNDDQVCLLIAKKAKLNKTDEFGYTSLMLAAKNGHEKALRALIEPSDAALLNAQEKDGNTALILAAQEGHDECVAALLDAGARLDMKNLGGETALEQARAKKRIAVVQLLCKYGADRSHFYYSPAYLQCNYGSDW